MLVHTSPFRELDSLFGQRTGTRSPWAAGRSVPMDAYRRGDDVWVHLDLPGVSGDSIDISVERNVLTVTAERSYQRQDGDQVYVNERFEGALRRQVSLGEGLDAEGIEADFTDGVLSLRVPVAQKAKPRKITVTSGQPALDADSSEVTEGSEGADDEK